MENILKLTKKQARLFILSYQGLLPPYGFAGKSGVITYISRVGCIQSDPLNVVGHNQELVLQSRISGFQSFMLGELLYKDRLLVDGWDKNMSIYSVRDWPFFNRIREAARKRFGSSTGPAVQILADVRKEIEERGPLSSIDLEYNQKVNWPWAPTRASRAALESMYFWGELIIHHKVNTRKVYDFACRHIPYELLSAYEPNEKEEEYQDWYLRRRIGSLGLLWNKSGDAWLGISGFKSHQRCNSISRLLERGIIKEVIIEGIDSPFYIRSEDLNHCIEDSPIRQDFQSDAAIIAPLDNMLWDRRLIKLLFEFDYRWEVYKPEVQREYGYYVLPVLLGDRFIARFEPGFDRKGKRLIIKNWWWEPGAVNNEIIRSALADCFKRFISYLGAESIVVSDNIEMKNRLKFLENLH